MPVGPLIQLGLGQDAEFQLREPTCYLFLFLLQPVWASLVGHTVKEFTCNVGDLGSIPGLGRSPEEGHGNPLQYSCLENPCGKRSLVGYSPWGSKESDTTEQLSTHR